MAASLGVSLGVPVGDVLAENVLSNNTPALTRQKQVSDQGKIESVQHKDESSQGKIESVRDELK